MGGEREGEYIERERERERRAIYEEERDAINRGEERTSGRREKEIQRESEDREK